MKGVIFIMKHLYMMRHGQTLFNVRRRIQGSCDSPLTELGIKQAEAAKELIRILLLIITTLVRLKEHLIH